MDPQAELERFKREISIVDYSLANGYELVREKSSAKSKMLKSADGDKIVVSLKDGHDVYFSVHDSLDKGTIIDFVKKRKQLNLGQARQELRAWIGSPAQSAAQASNPANCPTPSIPNQELDRESLERGWSELQPYDQLWLHQTRCLDRRVIQAFGVKQDSYRNACFVHRDAIGIVGWEKRNRGFGGFATGGNRSVMFSRLDSEPVNKIVMLESAIDALSYAQIVTSRRNPATGSRHIQATWTCAKRDLKAGCGSGYFAA